MKRISTLLPLLLLLLLVSCGQSREVSRAPQTQDEAGLIATCTTAEQAKQMAVKYHAKYRVLNAKAKLVEVIGISKDELQRENPRARVFVNKVRDQLVDSEQLASLGANTSYQAISNTDRRESYLYRFNHLSQIDATQLSSSEGRGVIIAILDTGIDYTHPHLNENIYIKSSEWTNGYQDDHTDGDGNGKIDDAIGWDFVNNDPYPMDDYGHGTHVAGLAAGKLSGVAPKAKLFPVKVLSHTGRGDIGTIAAGVLYAVQSGVHIINMSLGGSVGNIMAQDVQALLSHLNLARSRDMLMVAASGNGGQDNIGDCNDAEPIYPANANNDMIISVASVDSSNHLSRYSNYGNSVDIAAPGNNIYSTYIYECGRYCGIFSGYTSQQGTSMSAPLVSGLAAILKSEKPGLSMKTIKNIILSSGRYFPQLDGKIHSSSVINVAQAIDQVRTR